MNAAELAKHDGRDGRPAYVAVSGTIYDVSESSYWEGGNHVDRHQAGQDLTEEIKSAPHVRAVVERFPVVGRLETDPPPAQKSKLPLFVGLAVVVLIIIALFI